MTASHDGALKLWAWPGLALRGSVAMSKTLEAMAPVHLPLDLFVFTSDELAKPTGVARRALEEGIDLL